MFEQTRIKLTAWYLVIIMIISLLFSAVIYSIVNSEYVRFERMQIRIQEEIQNGVMQRGPSPRYVQINPQAIQDARKHLIYTLGIINVGIFVFAGGAGYFLAGRTLRPIKKSLDEQKRFVSDSSHELRTPLASLRSEIEVGLLDKKITLEKSKKILESNLEEVISLQLLSDRLLDLAQNGKAIKKDSMEVLSVKDVVDSAIKKTEKKAKVKKIEINEKISNSIILGIEDRIIEAFVIIIDNAIKYSPSKSTIEIFSKEKNDSVYISIKDSGIGISKKDIDQIFERFYRAQESRSEEGYGLGLSIAKRIVESHGGKIEVDSKINIGSTFTIILPKTSKI